MVWISKDGRVWSGPKEIGVKDFPISRVVWNNRVAWSYAAGTICGIMQTIRIFVIEDGTKLTTVTKKTFSGFYPGAASIIVDGDRVHCLMSRVDGTLRNPSRTALLGTAKPPFDKWEWKELESRIASPNLLRLPDKRIVAAVGLVDSTSRTSLCEFDPATGKLREFLKLPTSGRLVHSGLAAHDGHLWAAYDVFHKGKWSIHLAKVKLK
jgi:hypothetical protein